MTIQIHTVNLLLETHGSSRRQGGATWAPPMASITIHNLLLYTTNESWQVVNLKEAREFSCRSQAGANLRDDDGAKRVFFGGERFIEGISGEAYLYFSPATVKMLSNLKVLVIAVLLKVIMKRRFSIIQWEALALLLIGISVNQLRSLPEGTTTLGLPVTMGAYLYTLIFVTVPSMASVYNEYALKSQYDTSIYLQVMHAELESFS